MPDKITVKVQSVDWTYPTPICKIRTEVGTYELPVNPQDAQWWGSRIGRQVLITARDPE